MTYDPNTPANTSEFLSVMARKMRQNYRALNQYQDIDHYRPDDQNDDHRGKHRKMTLPAVADPTTAADEKALYQKDVSGTKQIHVRDVSSGAIGQITANNALVENGLQMAAAVVFDVNGNVVTDVETGQLQAFNVAASGVTNPGGTTTDYLITFTNAIGSAFYLWNCSLVVPNTVTADNLTALVQVEPDATYGNVVKTGSLKINILKADGSLFTKTDINKARVAVEVYRII